MSELDRQYFLLFPHSLSLNEKKNVILSRNQILMMQRPLYYQHRPVIHEPTIKDDPAFGLVIRFVRCAAISSVVSLSVEDLAKVSMWLYSLYEIEKKQSEAVE